MKLRTGVIVSLLTIAMLASVLQPTARAFIPEPYELYGVARDSSGVVLANGEPIRSFVDGVEYSNKTSVFSRPSQNDGYFDIDTYGNHMTNLLDPGTPEVKEGANLSEPIMYVWGDMSDDTGKGTVFEETHNWQTGLPPVAGDLNAAAPAMQPPLIKISSIVTRSQTSTRTDFVWLCNPTTSVVDASRFYIQKDVLGSFNGPTVPITGTIPANGGRLFVDLLSTTYFVETGDNVKLVYINTGGTGFGGNDIVVDRVEFNETTAGTLYWEPGNTIQGDEVAPLQGGSINRDSACADTNSRVQDFFPDIEVRPNNKPNPPNPICLQGHCSDAVTSWLYHVPYQTVGFTVTWTHIDPDVGDLQTQAIPRITDPGGGSAAWQTLVSGTTSSASISVNLIQCTNYELRVSTKDASQYGDEKVMPFHTNCLPSGLNTLAPPLGATVTAKTDQVVYWSQATDNDPTDSINYTWQVATDITFTTIVSASTTVNNYSAQFTTLCGGQYFWHVNASDGWVSIPYTSTSTFGTSVCGGKPTASAPTLDGHPSTDTVYLNHVTKSTPVFGWTYTEGTTGKTQANINIVVENTTTSTVVWDYNSTGTGHTTTSIAYGGGWTLDDGVNYRFHVKVADTSTPSLWSDWSPYLSFHMNTPPPVPTLNTPASGTTITESGSQTVAWNSVTDAESDTVSYTYCVGTTATPYPLCASATATVTTTTSNGFATTAGTKYYWAVMANDSYEDLGWSAIWNFTATSVTVNNPPSIVLTNFPATVDKNTQRNIQWLMSDTETADANLVVFLNYTYGGNTFTIARVVGVELYAWSIPNIDANNVVINATVIDEGGLKGWDTTASFNIVTPTTITPTPDNTVLYIAIIIIIVVVVLVLLLLMKRKKPKEEEEGAPAEEKAEEAPPEEEVAEEELVEEEAKPAPKAAPAAAAKPGAKPAGKTKECPSCGTIVSATDKECFMCGAKL